MTDTIFTVTSDDGVRIEAKISAPRKVNGVVLYVNASGPMTYNTKRRDPDGKIWNYHDFYAKEFAKRHIAYCRYSTRGVRDGDVPPRFEEIDDELFRTYLPHNSVNDILRLIEYIKIQYPGKPIWLFGQSEGTIVAPLVALRSADVAGLILSGYCDENLIDTLKWQLGGGSPLVSLCRAFDCVGRGYISREDFEEDRRQVRDKIECFKGKSFDELDADGDGKLTAPDIAEVYGSREHLDGMLRAIEEGDDAWLRENHGIPLTSGWFREHAELAPNRAVLPRLEIPIYILAGECDAMTPVAYARAAERRFKEAGKTNLTVRYFEEHDHELNFMIHHLTGKWDACEGLKCLFDTAGEVVRAAPQG